MPDRPNVVMVLCDQLRRQAIGCAGDPNVSTPHLDGLAEDGVRFSNACSTFPVCVPTRFSFVTGEYAHSRSVPSIDYQLSPAERTVADGFTDAGYRTAYVGKWHLAGHHAYRYEDGHDTARELNRKPVRPDVQGGFDHWRGFEVRNDPFDTAYFADDDPTPRLIDDYQTDGLFDLAFDFLDEQGDHPFFLVVSVEPPHPPFEAPEEYLEPWQDRELRLRENVALGDEEGLPGGYSSWGSTAEAGEALFGDGNDSDILLDDLRSYYAMVENLDANVGRLREELDRRGLRDETATVFLSDHGELLGSHALSGKQHPHEESVGVPFIVSHPGGGIDDGSVFEAPTCTEDWYPTLLGLAGIDAPETPGTDLTPLMRGDTGSLARDGVLLEFVREDRAGGPYSAETWRGFRTERYKYTVTGGIAGGDPWQLFDLRDDPYEQENLVDDPDHEALAARMHGHLREALAETGDDYRLKPAFGHDAYRIPEL
jgi:arylsulfatase A-like enzyme